MLSTSTFLAAMAFLSSAAASPSRYSEDLSDVLAARELCNGTITLDTTVTNYTVLSNDTIESIAASFNRGVCDLARENRMAEPTLIYAGEVLIIPAQVCNPDNGPSCYMTNNTAATDICVKGGPHTYTTFLGDTLQKIANAKFNISLAALQATAGTQYPDPYAIIEAGQTVKIPNCSNSTCVFQPYRLDYGTVVDLATEYDSTVGQMMALNLGYNHSDATTGPLLTVVMNCTQVGTATAES